jgi:hypothetical protein
MTSWLAGWTEEEGGRKKSEREREREGNKEIKK